MVASLQHHQPIKNNLVGTAIANNVGQSNLAQQSIAVASQALPGKKLQINKENMGYLINSNGSSQ